MNSVISQEQLNTILASMRDSIPKTSVLNNLNKSAKFNTIEKNEAYHRILQTINEQDSKSAAAAILGYMESIVSYKLALVAEIIDASHGDNSTADGKSTTGVGSPIFRRVG